MRALPGWSSLSGLVSAAVLVAGAVGATTTPAMAADSNLTIQPSSGSDATPLNIVSSGGCGSPEATNMMARIFGPGFPAAGQNVVANTLVSIYQVDAATGGHKVPLQNTLKAFAAEQNPPATLSGRYVLQLYCQSAFGTKHFRTYSATLTFSSPTQFRLTSPVRKGSPATTAARTPTPRVTVTTRVQAAPVHASPTPLPAPVTRVVIPTTSAPTSSSHATSSASQAISTATPLPLVAVTTTTIAAIAQPTPAASQQPTATPAAKRHRVGFGVAGLVVLIVSGGATALAFLRRRQRSRTTPQ